VLQRLLAADPRDAYVRCALARALEQSARWGDAAVQLRMVVKQYPQWSYGYTVWASAVLRTSDAQQMQDAVGSLRDLARQRPTAVNAHVTLGLLFLHGGKAAEAGEEFRAALRANARSAEAHFGLGRVAQAQGDLGAAGKANCVEPWRLSHTVRSPRRPGRAVRPAGKQAATKAEAALAEGECADMLLSGQPAVVCDPGAAQPAEHR